MKARYAEAESGAGQASPFFFWSNLVLVVFGLAYALIIPPFEAPDELSHFARIYGIAEGQFVLKSHPRELLIFFKNAMTIQDDEDRYVLNKIDHLLAQHEDRIPNIAVNTALYSFVPYFLHAVLIKPFLGGAPSERRFFIMFYFCRFISLSLFIGILNICFKIVSGGGWFIFWTAATPMALSQASVISIDPLVFGSTMMLLALSIEPPRLYSYTMGVVFAVVLLLMSKPTYAPLLLIPAVSAVCDTDAQKYKRLAALLAATAIALAGVLAWYHIAQASNLLSGYTEMFRRITGHELRPATQLWFMVQRPVEFFNIVRNSLSENMRPLFHQFVGVLGNLDIPLPFGIVVLWGLFAVGGLIVSPCPGTVDVNRRLLLGTTCLIAAGLAFIAVFANAFALWMPVGSQAVHVQGRYFHPILPAVFLGILLIRPFHPRIFSWLGNGWLSPALAALFNASGVHALLSRFGLRLGPWLI